MIRVNTKKNYSKVKVLTYEELTRREKSIMWKENFREDLAYFRYGGKLYVCSNLQHTCGYRGAENWDKLAFLAYTKGIVIRTYRRKARMLEVADFVCDNY